MNKSRAASWPMSNYFEAWKTFRRFGNEPIATASHVLSLPAWPAQGDLRILDIGCGDGKMIAGFISRLPSTSKVILLDPDYGMLSEAVKLLEGVRCSAKIVTQMGSADEEGVLLARDVDVGLAIHLVYLLSRARFRTFIRHWPLGVPLFVVLDAPNSVFSELWQHTAQHYAARSAGVHEYLSNNANGTLDVRRTDFATRVANPFHLDADARDLVLSLLCYCDFHELADAKRAEVQDVIQRHADGSELVCLCSCYQLVRRQNG